MKSDGQYQHMGFVILHIQRLYERGYIGRYRINNLSTYLVTTIFVVYAMLVNKRPDLVKVNYLALQYVPKTQLINLMS